MRHLLVRILLGAGVAAPLAGVVRADPGLGALAPAEERAVARLETAEVRVGGTARIVIEIAGEGAVDPELLDFPRVAGLAFEVESGPTLEPGAAGGLVARYEVLARVLQAGTLEIPGFSVRVRSDAVLVTGPLRIVAGGASEEPLTFRVEPVVGSVYANEPFVVEFSIERPGDSAPTMSRSLRLPWWIRVVALDEQVGLAPDHEVYEVEDRGRRIHFTPVESNGGRALLRARVTLLSPEAGPLDFSGSVLRFDPRATKPFSEPVDGGPRTEVVARPSRLEVLPWPEPSPPEFVDAVGDFAVAAEVDRPRAAVGELIRFAIRVVAAEGRLTNLRTANFATLAGFDGFRVYSRRDERSAGEMIVRLELAATRAGLAAVPEIRFAWFDPRKREYVRASVPPTPIEIAASTAPRDASRPAPGDEEEGVDWRGFVLAGAAVALAWVLGRAIRGRGPRPTPPAPARAPRDREGLRRRLHDAAEPFALGSAREIAAVIAERFGISASACFSRTIEHELIASGAAPETARVIARYFGRVEEISYSGATTTRLDDRELFAAVVRVACE